MSDDENESERDNKESTQPEPEKKSRSTKFRLIVALVVLVATALLVVYIGDVIKTENNDVASFDSVNRVEIKIENGDVRIIDATTPSVSVQRSVVYILGKPSVSQKVDGDTLVIKQECGVLAFARCETNYTLAVPPDVPVVAASDNGDISATGVKADLELTASNGKVSALSTFGRLQLKSDNGPIAGTDLSSLNVSAQAQNGDIGLRFTASPSAVSADTDNGKVVVNVPKQSSPFNVTADSANGKVTIDVRTDPTSPFTIKAHSDNGDVTVTR